MDAATLYMVVTLAGIAGDHTVMERQHRNNRECWQTAEIVENGAKATTYRRFGSVVVYCAAPSDYMFIAR